MIQGFPGTPVRLVGRKYEPELEMTKALTASPGVCTASIGMRGSICARDLNVGAGGPGGVRLPWARVESWKVRVDRNASVNAAQRLFFIVQAAVTHRVENSRCQD